MESELPSELEQKLAFNERLKNLDRKVMDFFTLIQKDISEEERVESLAQNEEITNNSLLADWHNGVINYRLLTRFLEKQKVPEREANEIIDNIFLLCVVQEEMPQHDIQGKWVLVKNFGKYLYKVLEKFKGQYKESLLDG